MRSLVLIISCVAIFFGCGAHTKRRVNPETHSNEIRFPTYAIRNACASNNVAEEGAHALQGVTSPFHYRHAGIPICSHHGRLYRDPDGLEVKLGQDLIKKDLLVDGEVEWPSIDSAFALVRLELGLDLVKKPRLALRCWYLDHGTFLRPAYEFYADAAGGGVNVISDGEEIFEYARTGFEASGRVSYQAEGQEQPNILEVDTFDESGFLSGKNFVIHTDSSQRPNSLSRNFVYDENDPFFAQASAYGNAELNLQWFKKLDEGSVDTECFPIDVRVHVTSGTRPLNNATYEPFVMNASGRPEIVLGDGDGISLRNLSRDPDVIAHEFAHHIIYRGLKDTKWHETVVLHEGLADYFVYARTGNACLAETICVQGNKECAIESACLRTANNKMTFLDENLPLAAHKKSQVISGMLWDLQKAFEERGNDLPAVVIRSLSYLLPRSSYRDFVVGLMMADRDLFNGEDVCLIYEKALERGLQSDLAGVNCHEFERVAP